ncbi:MAG: nuclear transport factor 2 family protein [Deltaproteobacteria bacterium]|nr:nuclear transport factor 2 family protein [Deltaproteobacteria bacterium]
MDDVSRLVARDEIRQLAYRYALAIDTRNIDTLVGLFVDDVRVGAAAGHAALRESFEAQLRATGITILFVANHLIDFDDDEHARGVVYCKCEAQNGDRWIHQAIQYRDTYERRAGRWLFVRRRHLLWYGSEVGQNPLALPPANWPESQTGRGTLPESEPTWQEFWRRRRS